MCTVGYGDIIPTNLSETVLSIFVMLVACGVFAHVVELEKYEFEKKKKKFQNKKNILN
jgi:hypothetical protein